MRAVELANISQEHEKKYNNENTVQHNVMYSIRAFELPNRNTVRLHQFTSLVVRFLCYALYVGLVPLNLIIIP